VKSSRNVGLSNPLQSLFGKVPTSDTPINLARVVDSLKIVVDTLEQLFQFLNTVKEFKGREDLLGGHGSILVAFRGSQEELAGLIAWAIAASLAHQRGVGAIIPHNADTIGIHIALTLGTLTLVVLVVVLLGDIVSAAHGWLLDE
jgi:hypothetical protein